MRHLKISIKKLLGFYKLQSLITLFPFAGS